jgi:hypothetical protein
VETQRCCIRYPRLSQRPLTNPLSVEHRDAAALLLVIEQRAYEPAFSRAPTAGLWNKEVLFGHHSRSVTVEIHAPPLCVDRCNRVEPRSVRGFRLQRRIDDRAFGALCARIECRKLDVRDIVTLPACAALCKGQPQTR